MQEAFYDACTENNAETVRALLAEPRVNPATQDNQAIRCTAFFGHAEVVRALLADHRVNPAARDNEAIRWAAFFDRAEVVRVLLADPRVNPAAQINEAIRRAANSGHAEVVRVLLADPRVNPAAQINEAIRKAAQYGHAEVVRLLLADPRVDPAAYDSQAIRWQPGKVTRKWCECCSRIPASILLPTTTLRFAGQPSMITRKWCEHCSRIPALMDQMQFPDQPQRVLEYLRATLAAGSRLITAYSECITQRLLVSMTPSLTSVTPWPGLRSKKSHGRTWLNPW
jgi:hypothetical protein